MVYFVESPRYLISKGETKKGVKSIMKIAKKNGKFKDFVKYLISDVSVKNNQKDFDNNMKINTSGNTFNNSNDIQYASNLSSNDYNNIYTNSNKIYHSPSISNTQTEAFTPEMLSSRKLSSSPSPTYLSNNFEDFIEDMEIEGNERDVPSLLSKQIVDKDKTTLLPNKNKEHGFFALFKYKSIRYTVLICSYLWAVTTFVYYGISMGLKTTGSDMFINGYVVYAAEGLSYIVTGVIISMPFFGRTRSISLMMCITFVSTAAFFTFNKLKLDPYDTISLGFARFGITAIFLTMYTYSTEVYPTVVRSKGVGINVLASKISGLLVPITVELLDPYLIFSSLCLVGFILSFYLNETLGKDLEDDILEEK